MHMITGIEVVLDKECKSVLVLSWRAMAVLEYKTMFLAVKKIALFGNPG